VRSFLRDLPHSFVSDHCLSFRANDAAPMYHEQIDSLLRDGYSQVVKGIDRFSVVTYIGDESEYPTNHNDPQGPGKLPRELRGAITIQYDPRVEENGCYVAKFGVWLETRVEPLILESWPVGGEENEKRNLACKSSLNSLVPVFDWIIQPAKADCGVLTDI
jgi:hypothetical protein